MSRTTATCIALLMIVGGVIVPMSSSSATAATSDHASYHPLSPARILDTRSGNGAPKAKLGPGASVNLQVTGRGGVPTTGVSAVVMNVTVTEPSAASHLTAWPTASSRPLASNLNYVAGQTVPNLVVAKVGFGGKVSLHNNSGQTHVIADVVGWYGADGATTGARYTPVVPSRILDTRSGNGAPKATLGSGATMDLQVTGRGGVPSTGVSAVVMNVTVTQPSAAGHLTAWPTGSSLPLASNLNFVAGQTVPNLVVTKVGTGGKVSLRNNSGQTHLIADVVGWYGADGATTGARYTPVVPSRILDTRSGNGAPKATLGSGATMDLQVTGRGGVPSTGVSAVVMNVTVTQPSAAGHLTAWPTGSSLPLASNLNFVAGQTVPNLVVAKVGTGGKVSLHNNSGQTHVIADVVGWYGEDWTGAKATTRPVGSAPLSDAEAATRVLRSSWEPRPENYTANHRTPTSTELAAFRSLNNTPALYKDKVTGDFTGTTDEIIQWAAHKWGIDEDLIRAAAVQESWWHMSTVGDGGISFGLMQIKSTVSRGTYPLSELSTAFNVDYYGASIRYYYDGAATWLNDPCCFSGTTYKAGDVWGSVGAWFAGRWYTAPAVDYMNRVKGRLSTRTWSQSGF